MSAFSSRPSSQEPQRKQMMFKTIMLFFMLLCPASAFFTTALGLHRHSNGLCIGLVGRARETGNAAQATLHRQRLHRQRCIGIACCSEQEVPSGTALLTAELRRRGLQTALDDLAENGPSAFKDPLKVIEYVMLNLQHKPGQAGIAEAFRFAAREPGKSSFVSGMALNDRRVSWRRGTFVEGYVSGTSLTLDDWTSEVEEHYSWLLGCTAWGFAVTHPETFEPLARSTENDYLREYLLVVDDRPVSVSLLYDWGCWCYLLFRVRLLDQDEARKGLEAAADTSTDGRPEDGRVRDRGGSL